MKYPPQLLAGPGWRKQKRIWFGAFLVPITENPNNITELYTRTVLSKGYGRLDCPKHRRAWTEILSNAVKELMMWVLTIAKGLEHCQHRSFNIRHSKIIKWF